MFRAYLAVIHDSFRAAFASRVLYIMLILIGLILLALAPLHLDQQVDWEIQTTEHVVNPTRLATRLVEEGKSGKRPAVAHVWNRLSPDLQQGLEDVVAAESDEDRQETAESGPPRVLSQTRKLVTELNEQLARRDFYDEEAFSGKGVSACAKKFGEEAVELALASVSGDKEHATAEAADVLYHLAVLLASLDVDWDDVLLELQRRQGTSGHAEKAARSKE